MRLDARCVAAWCLGALLAAAWADGAAAQPARKSRVVVRPFEGPSSGRVRDAVVQALGKSRRYDLVPNDRAEDAAEELGADLSADEGRAAAGRELELAGFVSGTIAKRGRQFVLELQVHGGRTGTLTDERTFRARRAGALVTQVRRRLAAQLRRRPLKLEQPALEVTEPEAEAETDAEEDAEARAEAEAERRRQAEEARASREAAEDAADEFEEGEDDGVPAFEAALGARLMTRSFAYEAPATRLPEHSVSPTPAAVVQLRAYPAAPFTRGLAAHLGIELYGQIMLPVEAQDGPLVYETTSRAFGGGVRGRIPLWPSELGVHAGWGAQDVEISDSQFGGDPEVPSVAYRFLRFGADGRLALATDLALWLRASYLLLLDHGELAAARWFPNAAGWAIDAQLGAGYALGGPFWVEAGVGITRYALTLDAEPAPPGSTVMHPDAEGAVDLQLSGTLAIAVRL